MIVVISVVSPMNPTEEREKCRLFILPLFDQNHGYEKGDDTQQRSLDSNWGHSGYHMGVKVLDSP